ncbi:MAG: response regulator transcription factor [Chloroflexi bacterium]|nr:response regulator transcription factor [Chloroflexota bacterium]
MTDETIRLLIVDDHAMVRMGMTAILDEFDDLELVAEASNGEDAVQYCDLYQPDVVLMDLMLPGIDGIESTRRILERHPHIRVIAITSLEQDDLVSRALKAGAIGYLMKNVSVNELARAIRSAHTGSPTLAPEAAQALIEAAKRPPQPTYDLTPREVEVLALMVEGMTNPEIADRLVISRHTVRAHVSNILSKLSVSSRVEAVALAIEQHLVTH